MLVSNNTAINAAKLLEHKILLMRPPRPWLFFIRVWKENCLWALFRNSIVMILCHSVWAMTSI